jgi:hypothetical protein
MGFCGFFLVHVGQVVLAGWNNFRSMVSGYEIQPGVRSESLPEPLPDDFVPTDLNESPNPSPLSGGL